MPTTTISNSPVEQRRFSMFLGVFTPSILTIIGVIMYLRFGWVLGHVGLMGALAIILICNAISLITAMSASAVATNMLMGAGGEYYLISRSLGLTIGGAIGIPLFLCRTLSVTLYCFGLAEALIIFSPPWLPEIPLQMLTAILVIIITAISGKSASASLKLQIPMMIMVGLSLAALAVGIFTGPLKSPQIMPLSPERLADVGGFWKVLAVFFPAVTGFTAGIGMSGDLKDPQRAIPKGTLLAVIIGLLTYLVVMVLLSITGKVTPEQLITIGPDIPPVWTRIAIFGGLLIFPGIWAAILSSAFGSALAGPRVLQALARDNLAPAFLARMSKTGQPTIATWVSGLIALSAVAVGDLNAVAILVTVLFLTLYLTINVVAATENLVADPSYRPTLKVHWAISLLGAVGALVIIFLISVSAFMIAIGLELTIWLYLRRKDLKATWGDVWAGVWVTLVRFALYNLSRQRLDPRNWRPNILLFADQIESRSGLVRLSAAFNQNHGILTVCDVMTGQLETDMSQVPKREESMSNFFRREGIVAFGEVDIVEDFESGVIDIVQANGMGGLRSNTIMFGWPSRKEKLESLLRIIRTLHHIGKASAIIRSEPTTGPLQQQRIDVWWRGKQNNGDLMLLLAYLLTLNPLWRGARITVRSIVSSRESLHDMKISLTGLIESTRIKADTDVILKPDDKPIVDIMRETSRDADVVMIGLSVPEPDEIEDYARRLLEIVEGMPTTVFVRNSGPFGGQLL
jgi:amino acid transporter